MSICFHIPGYCKTINLLSVAERSKALFHWLLRGVAWRGVGLNPAGDIYFHFEFFNPSLLRTAEWIHCN